MNGEITVRRICRAVTDRNHVVTEHDDIGVAMGIPGRGTVMASKLAGNIAGAVGKPASVFLDAGLPVWEPWLAEATRSRIVRWIGPVGGAHSLWPDDRPGYQGEGRAA